MVSVMVEWMVERMVGNWAPRLDMLSVVWMVVRWESIADCGKVVLMELTMAGNSVEKLVLR